MQKLNRKEESEEGKENYSIGFVIVKVDVVYWWWVWLLFSTAH